MTTNAPTQQPTPRVICTQCEYAAYDIGRSNEPCPECSKAAERKQGGVFASAVGLNDWAECVQCRAVGRIDSAQCSKCNGVGWLFARPRGIAGTVMGPPRGMESLIVGRLSWHRERAVIQTSSAGDAAAQQGQEDAPRDALKPTIAPDRDCCLRPVAS